jgi:hypothetical protein
MGLLDAQKIIFIQDENISKNFYSIAIENVARGFVALLPIYWNEKFN